MMLSIFSYVSGPSVCLLGEVSVQVFCPFFNWVVFLEWSCVSSLYILEIKPMSEVSFANMFSHTVGSLYFNSVYFTRAEAFYFDEVPFVYSFLCISCSRGRISENIAAWNI